MCDDQRHRDGRPAPCACQMAVTRAFREMHASGAPDSHCLDAALAVYRWHHPETAAPDAAGIVTQWVHRGALH